jgi:hypothetical protein
MWALSVLSKPGGGSMQAMSASAAWRSFLMVLLVWVRGGRSIPAAIERSARVLLSYPGATRALPPAAVAQAQAFEGCFMGEAVGKQRKAYCRKLVVAHLIACERCDLHALEAATGMPRRTLQDCIADLADIGIRCEFVQDGPKHRHGYYAVRDWGDHDPRWIAQNIERLRGELGAG